jgi:hypothetical protein
MLKALLTGEGDSDVLADLAKGQVRENLPTLRRSKMVYAGDRLSIYEVALIHRQPARRPRV